MNIADKLSFGALLLNLITLGIVLWQTSITRRALIIADESNIRDIKTRQLETLPRANFIIHVQMKLDQWVENIEKVEKQIRVALKDENSDALKAISEAGFNSPKGLVDRFIYEKSPGWLAEIYVSAARYYYSCMGPLTSLWDEKNYKANYFMCDSIIERCLETAFRIKELRLYIKNMVPDSYIEAPASLSDDMFVSD